MTPTINLKHPNRFFIGGKWVQPSTKKYIEVISSSTEEPLVRIAAAQKKDGDRAIAAAREAFDNGPWPRFSPAVRADYLQKIAMGLQGRIEEASQAHTSEVGIIINLARFFNMGPPDLFNFYAGLAKTFPFEESFQPSDGQGGVGRLVREPVGVVLGIVAWNAPMHLIAIKCAPALLAGCTVVLKASPEAPIEAYMLAEVAEQMGLPPGVLNVVTADREASEHMVRNPDVDKVSFTGSTAAGKRVAALCAERLARVSLELGGKSPAVVLNDTPVELIAGTMAFQATAMTGQHCTMHSRLIVPKKRHKDIVEALSAAFKAVKVGDPLDETTGMGPLVAERQLERVKGYIAKGKREGARIAAGGGRPKGLKRGFYIEPTLFDKVKSGMAIAQEEIFGPVLAVIEAKDEDDAIRIANDTAYELVGTVYTNDPTRAYELARRIRSGTVAQNGLRVDFKASFGGFKQSGLGREGGVEGLRPFLETKSIILAGEPG